MVFVVIRLSGFWRAISLSSGKTVRAQIFRAISFWGWLQRFCFGGIRRISVGLLRKGFFKGVGVLLFLLRENLFLMFIVNIWDCLIVLCWQFFSCLDLVLKGRRGKYFVFLEIFFVKLCFFDQFIFAQGAATHRGWKRACSPSGIDLGGGFILPHHRKNFASRLPLEWATMQVRGQARPHALMQTAAHMGVERWKWRGRRG